MKTDPKKKSIPKVLRPTITLPENVWCEVWECVYDRARQTLDRLAKHYPPTTAEMVRELEYTRKLFRLASFIQKETTRQCDSIRYPQDNDLPY